MVPCGNSSFGSLSILKEVGHGNSVRQVLVQVVLKHLDVGHFLSHKVELPHSWERETLIHQFPGGNHWDFCTELASNGHGVGVVFLVEGSGEVLHVHLQVLSRNLFAAVSSTGFSVALGEIVSVILLMGGSVSWVSDLVLIVLSKGLIIVHIVNTVLLSHVVSVDLFISLMNISWSFFLMMVVMLELNSRSSEQSEDGKIFHFINYN